MFGRLFFFFANFVCKLQMVETNRKERGKRWEGREICRWHHLGNFFFFFFKGPLPSWKDSCLLPLFPLFNDAKLHRDVEKWGSSSSSFLSLSWWVPCDCFGLNATGENHPCRKKAREKKRRSSSSTPTTLKKKKKSSAQQHENVTSIFQPRALLEKWRANGFLMTSAPRVCDEPYYLLKIILKHKTWLSFFFLFKKHSPFLLCRELVFFFFSFDWFFTVFLFWVTS